MRITITRAAPCVVEALMTAHELPPDAVNVPIYESCEAHKVDNA